MRTPLSRRAAAAFAAAALFVSLSSEAAIARGQMSFGPPAMRPGIAHGHGSAPGWRSGGGSSSTGSARDATGASAVMEGSGTGSGSLAAASGIRHTLSAIRPAGSDRSSWSARRRSTCIPPPSPRAPTRASNAAASSTSSITTARENTSASARRPSVDAARPTTVLPAVVGYRRGDASSQSSLSYPVSASSISRQRSSTSSTPAESLSRSGGHGEPAPSIEARCSMSDSTPPSEVARFHKLHPRGGRDRSLGAAADADRQHAAEAALHLPARDVVAGMMRQPGIKHGGDGRVIGEAGRELHRVVGRGAHAQVERSQAADQQERLERMEDEAVPVRMSARPRAERVVAREAQRARDHVGMAVEVFGRRVHHDVGAERDRPGEDRRRAGRVDRERRARRMRDVARRRRCR